MPLFLTVLLIVFGTITGIALLLFLIYLLVLVRPAGKSPQDPRLLRAYAHRGLHGGGVPENSLSAFGLAVKEGHGIELDVQLSSDGEVMVFHDYTLSRMTGNEHKLCELTKAELSALRLSDTDERIPTFSKVLEMVGGRVPLLVELKGESFDRSLCPRVAELLKAYNGPYCIESFNPLLVGEMKKLLPEAYVGLLYTNTVRDKKSRSLLNIAITLMALNVVARPNFISYNEKDRNAFPVRLSTGLYRAPRFIWTIKSKKSFDEAISLGECPIFEKIDRE